jgi:hypothetical protein
MTTTITQTGTSSEVHETAVAEAVAKGEAQPKDGLRGLASRVRRALGREREKAEPAALAATEAGGALQGTRVSVQALARSLLAQDRTGEPLEPASEDVQELAAEYAQDAEEGESAEVEEPKTVPRAKSFPPPLPRRTGQDSSPALAPVEPIAVVPVETAAVATEPAAPSRSAQLRARLAAAKAQRAQALAMLAEAPSDTPLIEASAEPEAIAIEEAVQADRAEDLDEFEDLEASALVEEPVSATR